MQGNVLELLLAKPWLLLIAIFCLGLSVFVHELGHYLAARWRGLYAPRFSIGFGRKICSWTDRHGTEFRLSWIPLGGYVALPQLADMGELEGGDGEEVKKLPPIGYLDKVFVAVAGASFNLLFAILLGSVLWFVGQDVAVGSQTTTIGYVMPTLDRPDGTKIPSPAAVAGLRIGDTVRSIDGTRTQAWGDVLKALIYGSGRTDDGQRTAVFIVERDGKQLTFTLYPELVTRGKIRRVGITRDDPIYVQAIDADKPAAQTALRPGDKILSVDGTPVRSALALEKLLTAPAPAKHQVAILRDAAPVSLEIPEGLFGTEFETWGLSLRTDIRHIRINPASQVWTQIADSLQNLWIVINPKTDVRAEDMGGPLEIVRQFVFAADDGIFTLIYLVLLINVALAVFNLMPIPVLDGGHFVFATIAKLRGRPLPLDLVAKIQTFFLVLLLSLMLYVFTNDVRRIARDTRQTSEEKQPEKTPEPAPQSAPDSAPAPAKP